MLIDKVAIAFNDGGAWFYLFHGVIISVKMPYGHRGFHAVPMGGRFLYMPLNTYWNIFYTFNWSKPLR